MKVSSDSNVIRQQRHESGPSSWGLVPTMGYLHEGHLSLVRRARAECDRVAVSIFVNPIQFNNSRDLQSYPQNIDRDLELLRDEQVDLVWTPQPGEVYPANFQTYVDVENITRPLEGASRPGHFRGVTTIVAKLFNLFQPDRAYFGEKDRQQLFVIQRMVQDLDFAIEIVPCPIVREPDGLAMSSRNARLTAVGREQAVCLHKALAQAKSAVANGVTKAEVIRQEMTCVIRKQPGVRIVYVSVAAIETLQELDTIRGSALVSVAAELDGVRLIDNILVNSST